MTASDIQRDRQEQLLKENAAQTGMPAIKNFRIAKMKKYIEELQDQEGLVTYTYLENMIPTVVKGRTVLGGKLTFFCNSISYGLPYATQFTAPETMQRYYIPSTGKAGEAQTYGVARLPQADPSGLFPPTSAEGTWVLCEDPKTKKVGALHVEPRVTVSPFKFDPD